MNESIIGISNGIVKGISDMKEEDDKEWLTSNTTGVEIEWVLLSEIEKLLGTKEKLTDSNKDEGRSVIVKDGLLKSVVFEFSVYW